MTRLNRRIKRIFCKHQYCNYTDTILIRDKYVPMRICKCIECGKVLNIKVEDWYIKNKECTHNNIEKLNIYVSINSSKVKITRCKDCNKIISMKR